MTEGPLVWGLAPSPPITLIPVLSLVQPAVHQVSLPDIQLASTSLSPLKACFPFTFNLLSQCLPIPPSLCLLILQGELAR